MDFTSMDKADLKEVLNSLGVSDTDDMDYDQMLATAISFSSLQESETPSFETSESIPNHTITENNVTLGSNTNASNEILDSKIQTFCDITGVDRENATHYLEACGYDLDAALSLHIPDQDQVSNIQHNTMQTSMNYTDHTANTYSNLHGMMDYGHFESTPISTATAPVTSTVLDRSIATSATPADIRQFLNSGSAPSYSNILRENLQSMEYDNHPYYEDNNDEYNIGNTGYSMDTNTTKKSKVDNDDYMETYGVRRPDPVKATRLVDDYNTRHDMFSRINSTGRADPHYVEWLFAPPRHLSYPGGFEEAKLLGKSDKKWILVNIQCHNDFKSNMLNRDTWTDETVEALIRSHFLFWQRGHLSEDGKEYIRLYHLDIENDLPHIAIIDPRTGAKLSTLKGYVEPMELISFLMEFIEANHMDSTTAPTGIRNMTLTSNISDITQYQPSTTTTTMYGNNNNDDRKGNTIHIDDDDDDDIVAISDSKPLVRDEGTHIRYDSKSITNSIPSSSSYSSSSSSTSAAAAAVTGVDTDLKPSATTTTTTSSSSIQVDKRLQYGPVPQEPDNSTPADMIARIAIRLVSGKTIKRKFYIHDTICSIYAYVASLDDDTMSREFDLTRSFPVESLFEKIHESIKECNLSGTQIVMQWK